MDFSASFSLNALQDAKKALTELYQFKKMTMVQYESFFSFFENLRVEESEAQLANINIVLEELSHIFTIIQTYYYSCSG